MTVALRISAASNFRTANSAGVSATATEIDRRLTERGLTSELTKLAELAASQETTPSEAAVELAIYYLHCVFDRAYRLGSWAAPHMTLSESGEIVFEWWCRSKKITLYFGDGTAEYLKVWGTNIETEMDSGVLNDGWTLTSVWLWLHS